MSAQLVVTRRTLFLTSPQTNNTDDAAAYKSVTNTRNLIWYSEHSLYLATYILMYKLRKMDTDETSSKR